MYRTFYYVFGLAANDDDDGAEKVREPAKLSVYFDGSTRKVGESSKCKTQQTNQNPSDDYTFCLYPCKFMTKRRSRKHKHKHNHYGSLESTAFFRSPTRPTKCIAKRTSSREPHSQHTHTHSHSCTHRRKEKKLMAYCEQMKITSQTLNIHVNMFTLNIESTPPNGKKQGNEWKSVMYFLRFTFRNFVFLSPLTMRRMRRLHSPPRDIFSNIFLFVWILKWWTFRERKKLNTRLPPSARARSKRWTFQRGLHTPS